GAFKDPTVRIDGYRPHIHLELVGDDFGQVVDKTDPVCAHDLQARQEGNLLLTGPSRFDDPVAMVGYELQGIGTGSPVNLDPLIYRHKAKNLVPRDRIAAAGQN